jgi:hypothetical protein
MRDFFGDKNFSGGYKFSDKSDRYYKSSSDDILEDDKYIYITFELKTEDSDYEIIPREDVVIIYIIPTQKQIIYQLPHKVNPKSEEHTFKNYIMDIRLEKLKDGNIREDKKISGKE